jgi:hypothetical protein
MAQGDFLSFESLATATYKFLLRSFHFSSCWLLFVLVADCDNIHHVTLDGREQTTGERVKTRLSSLSFGAETINQSRSRLNQPSLTS